MAEGIMMQTNMPAQELRGTARLKWLLQVRPSYVIVVSWALGEFFYGLSLLARPNAEAIYQSEFWQAQPELWPLALMAGAGVMVAGYALLRNLAGAFLGMIPLILFTVTTMYRAMNSDTQPLSQIVSLILVIVAFFVSLYAAETIENMQRALAAKGDALSGAIDG